MDGFLEDSPWYFWGKSWFLTTGSGTELSDPSSPVGNGDCWEPPKLGSQLTKLRISTKIYAEKLLGSYRGQSSGFVTEKTLVRSVKLWILPAKMGSSALSSKNKDLIQWNFGLNQQRCVCLNWVYPQNDHLYGKNDYKPSILDVAYFHTKPLRGALQQGKCRSTNHWRF